MAASLSFRRRRLGSAHERGTTAAIQRWLKAEAVSQEDVIEVLFESEQRARTQQARQTRRGDELGTYPDALLVVRATGGEQTRTVAIELISRKYSDAMIRKKGSLLARFPEVVFYGDTPHTCARVERLLGERCRCI